MSHMIFGNSDKKLQNWVRGFDAEEYVRTGSLPEGMPEDLQNMAARLHRAVQMQYESDLLKKQMQYTALQSQINPHFLYNTLEAIRSEAILQNNNEIADMTERLARFFRYGISSRGDFVTVQDELENLQNYFAIQQYRFGQRFHLAVVQQDDAALRCYMPKMTLQPLVENAIHHGLEPKKGEGNVTLRLACTERAVNIWVCDDGVGMAAEQVRALNERLRVLETVTEKHGLALRNVNARIRLYFGEEYGLRVSSISGAGTEVELLLPHLDELALSRLGNTAKGK